MESHRNERCDTKNRHVDKQQSCERVASRSRKKILAGCMRRTKGLRGERTKGTFQRAVTLRTASFRGWCRAKRREFSFVYSTVTSLLLRVLYVYTCISIRSCRSRANETERGRSSLASLLICSRCSSSRDASLDTGWKRAPPIKTIWTCFHRAENEPRTLYLEFCLKFSPLRAYDFVERQVSVIRSSSEMARTFHG